MKKLAYLMTIIFAFMLVSTSCSKKNDDDDLLNGITVNDLVGDWHFQSLEFNDKVYEVGDDFTELLENYDFVRVSFLEVTTTNIGLHNRGNNMPSTWNGRYKLSRNTIFFQDWFEFHIENWETFDGSTLIVELLKSKKFPNAPVGAVYTMTREDPI